MEGGKRPEDRRYRLSGALVNCNIRLEGRGLQARQLCRGTLATAAWGSDRECTLLFLRHAHVLTALSRLALLSLSCVACLFVSLGGSAW